MSYYGARFYDPSLGRFLVPDTVIPDPAKLVAFNRYAYTYNNPIIYTDPTGHSPLPSSDTFSGQSFWSSVESAWNSVVNSFESLFEDDIPAMASGSAHLANIGLTLSDPAEVSRIVAHGLDRAGHAQSAEIAKNLGNLIDELPYPQKFAKKKAKKMLREFTESCCCFVAGTSVWTSEGPVAIETLSVGDSVYSRDPATGATALKAVTELFVTQGKPLYELVVEAMDGDRERIEVTDNHPFWVIGSGWTASIDLKPGMEVASLRGPPLHVSSLSSLNRVELTYNLTVADFHTYFVGEQQAFVHNACDCGVKFKRWKRGEPIDKPLGDGSAPSWKTVRERYWKNRAMSSPDEFSRGNLKRLRQGKPPLDFNPRTKKFEARELHHVTPQRANGANNPLNLRELTPDQHGAVDPYRHTVPTTRGIR